MKDSCVILLCMVPFIAVGIAVTGYAGYQWKQYHDLATAEYSATACVVKSKSIDTWETCVSDDACSGCTTCYNYNVAKFMVLPQNDLRKSGLSEMEAFKFADREGSTESGISSTFLDSIAVGSTVPCWQREDDPSIVKLAEGRATDGSGAVLLPVFLTIFSCCWNGVLCIMFGALFAGGTKVRTRGIALLDNDDIEDAEEEEEDEEQDDEEVKA